MGEVLVQLPPPLYQRLMDRAEREKRDPVEAIIEAIERWLREEEDQQPSVEERFQRALERTGLLVPPEERTYAIHKPVGNQSHERDLHRVRGIMAKLETPLSEDIIQDRR
jgi:predicted transcriptional regulator